MGKSPEESFAQAKYDMSNALYMLDGGRYFDALFIWYLYDGNGIEGTLPEYQKLFRHKFIIWSSSLKKWIGITESLI